MEKGWRRFLVLAGVVVVMVEEEEVVVVIVLVLAKGRWLVNPPPSSSCPHSSPFGQILLSFFRQPQELRVRASNG